MLIEIYIFADIGRCPQDVVLRKCVLQPHTHLCRLIRSPPRRHDMEHVPSPIYCLSTPNSYLIVYPAKMKVVHLSTFSLQRTQVLNFISTECFSQHSKPSGGFAAERLRWDTPLWLVFSTIPDTGFWPGFNSMTAQQFLCCPVTHGHSLSNKV